MSLSVLDKIKLKTQQILVKTDDYLRQADTFGPKATQHSMIFAGTATMAGILGVWAIVAAPTLPALAGIAAIASMPTAFTVGGAAINVAGVSLLGGGGTGVIFAGLTKLYNSVRGTQNFNVNGDFECILKDNNGSIDFDKVDINNVVLVNRKEVLKSIENGTFHEKYAGIRTLNEKGPGYSYYKIPKERALEVITTLPYYWDKEQYVPRNAQWEENFKAIRRECFKEAKSFDLKAKILNRMNAYREGYEGQEVKRKYNV